jgi:hypothetical protein
MSSICRWDRVTGGQGFTSGNALTENQPARLSPRPADYQSVPCPFSSIPTGASGATLMPSPYLQPEVSRLQSRFKTAAKTLQKYSLAMRSGSSCSGTTTERMNPSTTACSCRKSSLRSRVKPPIHPSAFIIQPSATPRCPPDPLTPRRRFPF